jgi:hypothetical protein
MMLTLSVLVVPANLPADEIIEKLNAAVDRNNQILATARHVRQQRTEAQILREQQDREYQESLAADRRREQEAREQAEREDEERLQKEEEERRAEEEARRAEEEEIRQEEEYKAEIEVKRARIADGPKARMPPPGADFKTAVIKFHLYNGTRLDHIFYAHDTLKTVRDFIDVEFFDRDIKIRNYELATKFPKKVYGPDLLDVTLTDVVRACIVLLAIAVLRGCSLRSVFGLIRAGPRAASTHVRARPRLVGPTETRNASASECDPSRWITERTDGNTKQSNLMH